MFAVVRVDRKHVRTLPSSLPWRSPAARRFTPFAGALSHLVDGPPGLPYYDLAIMVSQLTSEGAAERKRAFLIGLALLCCYGYFFYLGGNWNVESRSAQIYALAEHRTLIIDDYPFLPEGGGDAARYQGHYYSDKLIVPSLLAAPAYWAARRALTAAGLGYRAAVYWALRITNLLVNAIPSALLGALLYLFLAQLGIVSALRVWLAFAYGLGTLALPYSTVLFGHQFAAVCVAGSFMLLWRQRRGWLRARAAAAGALAGLAAMSDVMGLFIAFFLGLYALWLAAGRPRRESVGAGVARLALFAGIAAVPIGVQLLANWASFGTPFTMPHVYHAQESFRARHTAGLFGIHLPQLYPLYQLTIGPWRGLFHGSPVLLLALPGFLLFGRRWRTEAVLIGAAWLSVLLMHSGYENWTTGSAYGPRYQIAAIPLLMIAAAPAAQRWPLAFKALAIVSVAFMVIVTAHTPFVPEDLRRPLAAALEGFAGGELFHANLGMRLPGLWSLCPLAVIQGVLLFGISRVKPD